MGVGMGAGGAVEDSESALMSAVRAGDTDLVRILLHEDRDLDGLETAFCLAIRMRAGRIAQLLLQYGADPGESRREDLLPLSEAVDSGSPALFEALLGHEARSRYTESELLEARDRARHWQVTGVEAELRRRTGSRDGIVRTPVQDDEYTSADEFSLGGMTVRDGHGAILTHVEELLRIRTSFEDLMERALAHAGQDHHTTWSAVTILLAGRCDQVTWSAAAALRTDPDPFHRLFGAEVLRLTHLFDSSDEDAFAGPAVDVFTDWSTEETAPSVLAEVLVALGEHEDLRAQASLLRHVGHPDARVRCAVAQGCISGWRSSPFSGDARTALLRLMTDLDPVVRKTACHTMAGGRDDDPACADALAAALDDPERPVRLAAVHGLALRDDERCVEAARRLGPPQRGSLEEEFYLGEVWRYEWRRDHRSHPSPTTQ
ncbi:HEAT repeat domain-containing protein [Streptomyces sp. NPDC093224]|uniref:HEAT repeat domain-containing protein n=1 Tax=Streptomyces sp. NPDC093224 TaxID=3155198 RepID=UPI0034200724